MNVSPENAAHGHQGLGRTNSSRKDLRTAGCEPVLYVQPTHRLELPRRYRTIINWGAFGLGGSRADDTESLRRLRAHLLPGGVLALDYEVGEFDDDRWRRWRPRSADETPPPSQERRQMSEGRATLRRDGPGRR